MSIRPAQMLPGLLLLSVAAGALVYRALSGDALSGMILLGLTVGPPVLVMVSLVCLRLRALVPLRALARLAMQTAGRGRATDAERQRAQLLCARYRARCTGLSDRAAYRCAVPALDQGGPLRGFVAYAATARTSREAILDRALENLDGIDAPQHVDAVARWLRASSAEPRERLVQLVRRLPQGVRGEALRQLLPLCDPPGPQWDGLIQPFAEDVEVLFARSPQNAQHPVLRVWAERLRQPH